MRWEEGGRRRLRDSSDPFPPRKHRARWDRSTPEALEQPRGRSDGAAVRTRANARLTDPLRRFGRVPATAALFKRTWPYHQAVLIVDWSADQCAMLCLFFLVRSRQLSRSIVLSKRNIDYRPSTMTIFESFTVHFICLDKITKIKRNHFDVHVVSPPNVETY